MHLENLFSQNSVVRCLIIQMDKELEKFALEDEFIRKIIAGRRKIKPLNEYVLKNSRMNNTAY